MRNNTDDRVRDVIEIRQFPHNVGIGEESPLPQFLAEQHDSRGVMSRTFIRAEQASLERSREAIEIEELTGHEHGQRVPGIVGEVQMHISPCGNV